MNELSSTPAQDPNATSNAPARDSNPFYLPDSGAARKSSPKRGWFRRLRGWLAVFVIVLIAGYGLVLHPYSYVIESPGPTINLLENTSVGGKDKPIVEVADNKAHPRAENAGQLRLVTVSLRGGPGTPAVRGWELILAYFNPSQQITAYEKVFPRETTGAEEQKLQKQFMTASQDNARAAALTALDVPFSSTIKLSAISPKSDGYNKLKPDDYVVAIEKDKVKKPIDSTADLYHILEATPPGTPIIVSVKRAGKPVDVQMRTIDPGPGRKGSLLGAFIQADYTFPYPININIPESIGGPSAGTVFALTMMDTIQGGSLDPHDSVAVTGTMSPNGQVGPIGGVVQKIYGAQRDGAKWFLAPSYNCDELADKKLPKGITPVRISTLSQAAEVLKQIGAGNTQQLPVCPHR